MTELEQRVRSAQIDPRQLDSLLDDYLPLIKKEVLSLVRRGADYEDLLSVAMLAFVRMHIRSRVVDQLRRDARSNVITIPFDTADPEQTETGEQDASLDTYARDRDRQLLAEEIQLLREELKGYGIAFEELPRVCPKQERSRMQCLELAQAVAEETELRQRFRERKQLPQGALAEQFHLSPKTVEKHRKYIVALIVLLLGDYTAIRTFLPQYKEVR